MAAIPLGSTCSILSTVWYVENLSVHNAQERPVVADLLTQPQNQVRKALNPEHYNHHGMPVEVDTAHTYHCIDTIRQHIQCYGSTTLIPTKWREGAHRQYIDSNQEHVCRDFSYLHKYMQRRSNEGDLYVPRDKKMLGMAKAWEHAWEDNEDPH